MAKDEVSVTMTEKQKDKVVELFAKEKAAPKMVMHNLLFGHQINGQKYGPGNTLVPEDLVGHFMATDAKALDSRIKENESNSGMVEILGRGISRKINGGF